MSTEDIASPEFGAAPYWLWVDLETTGLSPRFDAIMEIGLVVTTPPPQLAVEAEFSRVLSLAGFNGKVWEQHDENGLWEATTTDAALEWNEAMHEALGWLSGVFDGNRLPYLLEHGLPKGPMCGAGVHFDREFLNVRTDGRAFCERLWTYRNFDVSTLREFAERILEPGRMSDLIDAHPIAGTESVHRVLSDLGKSIAITRLIYDALRPAS